MIIPEPLIKVFVNGLSEEVMKRTHDFLFSPNLPWCFSQTSHTDSDSVDNPDSPTFWESKIDINKNEIISNLWDEMYTIIKNENIIDENLEVIRTYANGQTYGLNGGIHQDDISDGTITVLYYPVNEYWNPEWHGETFFYSDDISHITAACIPRRNSFVVFDSQIPHVGMAPNKQYNGLRVTLAFKCRKV